MPMLNDNMLRTIADELFELVKQNRKISLEDASKKLNVPFAAIESLVEFLVEEKVFGVEYKFTTPYIYLYKEGGKGPANERKNIPKQLISKEQFYKMAREKNINYEHIEGMWRNYLQQNLSHIREEFFGKARNRRIPEEMVHDLWRKYLSYL